MHTKADNPSSNAGNTRRDELERTLPYIRNKLAAFAALADLADDDISAIVLDDFDGDASFKTITDAMMQAAEAFKSAGEAVERAMDLIDAEGDARVH